MALCHLEWLPCFVLVAVLCPCLVFGLFCCVSRLVVFSVSLHCDGLLECVLVLLQHHFCGPSPTRWSNYSVLIRGTCCMPMERVDRQGESQEATGGKKGRCFSLRLFFMRSATETACCGYLCEAKTLTRWLNSPLVCMMRPWREQPWQQKLHLVFPSWFFFTFALRFPQQYGDAMSWCRGSVATGRFVICVGLWRLQSTSAFYDEHMHWTVPASYCELSQRKSSLLCEQLHFILIRFSRFLHVFGMA